MSNGNEMLVFQLNQRPHIVNKKWGTISFMIMETPPNSNLIFLSYVIAICLDRFSVQPKTVFGEVHLLQIDRFLLF